MQTLQTNPTKSWVLIRRTLKTCSKPVKKRAYETLVRPKVEYAYEAWNPHTDQDVDKIEQVQKNAARFVCNNYDRSTSSSDLVKHTGLGHTGDKKTGTTGIHVL